jgi:hypothetical protein
MGDWNIDTSWLDRLKEDFAIEGQLLCDEAAEEVMARAKARIPQPGMSKGYATGAAKESGYTANPRTSGYDQAIAMAKAAPGTRIVERDQIEPEEVVDVHGPDSFMAIVHFPLTYVDLIRFGYYHVQAKKQIPGNDFFLAALNPVERKFNTQANRVARYLMAKYNR